MKTIEEIREGNKQRQQKYRVKNLKKSREYKRKWQAEWRKNNPEAQREVNRKAYSVWRKKNLAKARSQSNERVKQWRLRNPEKYNAHRLVFMAKRNGSLKKGVCACGEKEVQAHHWDYSKPLDVVWMCKKHHEEADLIRRGK